jgi:hypothetical protein
MGKNKKNTKIERSEQEKSASAYVRKILQEHRKLVEARLSEASQKSGQVPLSESLPAKVTRISEDIQEKMTAKDCSDILRGMAHNEPQKVISRNYFRNHSGIKESTWNRYYGTFEEFKRQAGIKLSRHVHKLERDLAKHASADHYRALSETRIGLDKKYLRPSSKRFQTLLVFADVHDVDCDPFALRVLLDVAKRAEPIITQIVAAGDIFDLPEFGRFTQDPREWDVVGRIKFTHDKLFKPLRQVLPKTEFWFLEGNHEARLLRHLADSTPAMKAVLSDLHGFNVPKLLGLDKFEINYVGRGDLAARNWTDKDHRGEIEKNWKVFHKSFLIHHYPEGRKKNMPGCHGHHHKHLVWSYDSPVYGAYEWHQLGGMHIRDASYTDGQRWNNGFALVHIDTHKKVSNVEYIMITDFCYAGGKPYERKKSEEIVKITSL